jgi:hypothetical protein
LPQRLQEFRLAKFILAHLEKAKETKKYRRSTYIVDTDLLDNEIKI